MAFWMNGDPRREACFVNPAPMTLEVIEVTSQRILSIPGIQGKCEVKSPTCTSPVGGPHIFSQKEFIGIFISEPSAPPLYGKAVHDCPQSHGRGESRLIS